jgi:hypothetical protein
MSPFWEQGRNTDVRQEQEEPRQFFWQWRWHPIREILQHWRVHAYWWTDHEVWRDYWEVTTDTGLLCTLYYDRLQETWYLERVYE